MSKLKDYKGVAIYVNPINGQFYCDAANNSDKLKDATFYSKKLYSIEKAIDEYTGTPIDGKEYYEIQPYNATIKKLKVIKKVGDRLFFDNGSQNTGYNKPFLYPVEIESKEEFKELTKLFNKMKNNRELQAFLQKDYMLLYSKVNLILDSLQTVKVKE